MLLTTIAVKVNLLLTILTLRRTKLQVLLNHFQRWFLHQVHCLSGKMLNLTTTQLSTVYSWRTSKPVYPDVFQTMKPTVLCIAPLPRIGQRRQRKMYYSRSRWLVQRSASNVKTTVRSPSPNRLSIISTSCLKDQPLNLWLPPKLERAYVYGIYASVVVSEQRSSHRFQRACVCAPGSENQGQHGVSKTVVTKV